MTNADVIIIGAGAAGLMCAITAANRGRRVLVLERSNKPGKKILMSGGWALQLHQSVCDTGAFPFSQSTLLQISPESLYTMGLYRHGGKAWH